MDYYEFLEEFDSYNEWNNIQKRDRKDLPKLDTKFPKFQSNVRSLKDAVKKTKDDRINSPSHYTCLLYTSPSPRD